MAWPRMRVYVLFVVVAVYSPSYVSSPITASAAAAVNYPLGALSPSQLWRAKNKLRLPHLGWSRWVSADCAAWARTTPTDGPDDDSDSVACRCAADILALVGGTRQRELVNASRARDLLSCIRFLVPVKARRASKSSATATAAGRAGGIRDEKEAMWKMIREPPAAVADLARKAVEWAGEPEALLAELGSTLYKVPDIEGANADKCVLTKHDCAKRFAKEEINTYMAFLFEAIAALAPSAGFNVSLNRYDLFHGHMFTAYDTGRLGILFHSREYPEFDKTNFPLNLGYCQTGSFVPYDQSMNLRNILWLAPMPSYTSHACSDKWLAPGALFILDARPDGLVFKELVSEWVDVVRTIYESDFGQTVIDVNYLNVANSLPEQRIFLA